MIGETLNLSVLGPALDEYRETLEEEKPTQVDLSGAWGIEP